MAQASTFDPSPLVNACIQPRLLTPPGEQWYGGAPRTILFNDDVGAGDYRTVIQDLASGERREHARPQASVTRDGRWGLSINFDRMFDFRPGYGYHGKPDPFRDVPVPAADGVFLLDLANGAERLILSYPCLWEQVRSAFSGQPKLLVNHINFNPSGSRFVLLLRNFREPGPGGWHTATLVAERDGGGLRQVLPVGLASHYWWTDDDHLLIWADAAEGRQLYLVDVRDGTRAVVDADYFTWDGHCSTSPDGRWMLYDSYNIDGYRHLFLYDLHGRQGRKLAEFLDLPVACNDTRCDLHPVWNRAGTGCSIDATFEGFRGVYFVDLRHLIG